jgi:4-hydroxy 2-oxovalerate aldolase
MKVLDCTLRDGGYINNWRFSTDFLNSYISTINDINVDYIEIGFINKNKTYSGQIVGSCRNLTSSAINDISKKTSAKIVVMADFDNINKEILKENVNIDMVRIAFHKQDMENALELCKEIKSMGYIVSANAMAVTNYSEEELQQLFNTVNNYDIDILYIADSYGSLSQTELTELLKTYQTNCNAQIGIHLHNNMQNAFSNFESVIETDLFVDSTMFGMGRGAGNLNTELVITTLQKNISMQSLKNMLTFIQEFVKPHYKILENKWGYDLDYLMSGFLKIHPNYVVKMRELNVCMCDRFDILHNISTKYDGAKFTLDSFHTIIDGCKDFLV